VSFLMSHRVLVYDETPTFRIRTAVVVGVGGEGVGGALAGIC
jgi:hypothetical protein